MNIGSNVDYAIPTTKVVGNNWIFLLFFVFYSLSPYLYILRVLLPDSIITWIALRFLEPFMIIVLVFSLFYMKKIRFDLYSFMILPLLIYGIASAILWQNEGLKIVTGASHFIFGFVVYLYFKNQEDLTEKKFERFLFFLAILSLVSLTIVVSVMVFSEYVLGINVYLGLSCQVLIVAFYLFLYQNKNFLVILTIGIILLSGKRGVLVALLLSMFVYSFPFMVVYRLKEVVIAICFGATVLISIGSYNSEFIEKIGDKFTLEDTKSVNDFSSGRLNEALSAVDFFAKDNVRMLLGSGFGFKYIYRQEDKSLENVEDYGNVHFSPLNPLIIFGSVIAIIYFLILILLILKTLMSSNNGIRWPMKSALIGSLVYTIFVFNLFNEPILWALMGFLNREVLEA